MNPQKDSLVLRGLKEQSGQAGPWMALLTVMMIGIVGLVVDVGHAYVCHRELQASTDAASLAGAYAMTLPGATTVTVNSKVDALSSATNNGVTGANATQNLPAVTIAPSIRCVTDSLIVTAPCSASATGYNVIQVVQSSTIPTYFIRVLSAFGIKSAQSMTVTTISTATMMAGKAAQVNVAMVLDTTASMGNSDTDINCKSPNPGRRVWARAPARSSSRAHSEGRTMERKGVMALDSLRRVQGFLDTHADAVGPLKDTEARKQLDAAVTALWLECNFFSRGWRPARLPAPRTDALPSTRSACLPFLPWRQTPRQTTRRALPAIQRFCLTLPLLQGESGLHHRAPGQPIRSPTI